MFKSWYPANTHCNIVVQHPLLPHPVLPQFELKWWTLTPCQARLPRLVRLLTFLHPIILPTYLLPFVATLLLPFFPLPLLLCLFFFFFSFFFVFFYFLLLLMFLFILSFSSSDSRMCSEFCKILDVFGWGGFNPKYNLFQNRNGQWPCCVP
jgi:hypothetical protein